jgi:hypothetical protein
MNSSKFSFVPLQQASLCLDCDMITCAHTHCSACGSIALLNLARTLDSGSHILASHATMGNLAHQRSFESMSISDRFPRRPHRMVLEPPFSEVRPTVNETPNVRG